MSRALLYSLAVFLLSSSLLLPAATAQSTAIIRGTVTDASDNSPLAGANVTLLEPDGTRILGGTATGPGGAFVLPNLDPGSYTVEVRFIGYRSEQRAVTVEAGETATVNVALRIETSSLETVVVSASRRQEKVLDAPASISVLEPQELERTVSTSTVEALRATPGVDMAQTGIDRREVVLRGFNEAFSGSAYVLTDYREAAVPSLGVNVHSIMPNMSLDVARVEVVRGPGSALYGPGVDSGVIHYFTKGPFEEPGTSISVSGGQRSFLSVQGRQAGTLGNNWGYKITGQYARATEWDLDPNDPQDAAEIARYRVYESRSAVPGGRSVAAGDFDGDGDEEFQLRREDEYYKMNVNGLLEYRFNPQTTLSLNGGYSQLKGVVQSGIGTLQADGFGYSYGQVRLRSGGLFAQVYLNANDAGNDTYVYGSGDTVVDKGLQWNAQVQYDFRLNPMNTQFIVGGDADLTRPRTEGEILGRNEDDDAINEYGLYAQSSSRLTDMLDLTLALRADFNNIVEEVQFAPRAALVFKPLPQNTFRASYNRSFSSPGTNSNFLDIEAQRQSLPGGNFLVFQGLGAADGFTFRNFRETNGVRFFLPAPGFFKETVNYQSMPVAPIYGVAVAGLLGSNGQLPDGVLTELSAQQRGLLAQVLGYTAQNLASIPTLATGALSGAATQLGIPDDSEDGFRAVSGPVDIEPLEQTTTNTFEVGYKGLLGDRVLVSVDGYYERKEDFIGPLVVESPLVYLQGADPTQAGLAGDVAQLMGQTFLTTNDPTLQALRDQLLNSGLSAQQIAGILGALVGGALNNQPAAVVQPDQQVLPGGGGPNEVGGFLSYRNFGTVEYWGIDASLQLQLTDALDVFANASIVSDDFFDNEELDEENQSLSLALNAPAFKVKSGFDYRLDNGFSFGASGNYVQGFPVETGPYVGSVEEYFLLDLHAGYRFPQIPGLRLNVSAQNVLDNEHREFVGAPALGRTIFGRLTYTLP